MPPPPIHVSEMMMMMMVVYEFAERCDCNLLYPIHVVSNNKNIKPASTIHVYIPLVHIE